MSSIYKSTPQYASTHVAAFSPLGFPDKWGGFYWLDSPIKDGSDQKNYLPVEVESTSEPSTGVSYSPDIETLAVCAGKAFEGS